MNGRKQPNASLHSTPTGQHCVCDIARLTEALLRDGADFALGSRFLGQAPSCLRCGGWC